MTKPPGLARFPAAVALAFVVLAMAGAARAGACDVGPAGDAARNASTYADLPGTFFGRLERGWAVYEALIMRDIHTDCPGPTPGFAAALSRWKAAHGLGPSGTVDDSVLGFFRHVWSARRPFVAVSKQSCPPPPPEQALAKAAPAESYGGKIILLRASALAAYRRMVAEARRSAVVANDHRLFTIFSGYRSPDSDAARCAAEQNCQGVVRAACSAHRTGLAMDLFLGAAPGFGPDSSNDLNRLYIARASAYRWLVRNADRFGFVNYPFEPWHWEWTGEKP